VPELLRGVLLCIAIGAIAWILTSPPLPPTTSPYLGETFLRRESPAELAFSYQLRAMMTGWYLREQDGNCVSLLFGSAERVKRRSVGLLYLE
jgi:hypothetical protein